MIFKKKSSKEKAITNCSKIKLWIILGFDRVLAIVMKKAKSVVTRSTRRQVRKPSSTE